MDIKKRIHILRKVTFKIIVDRENRPMSQSETKVILEAQSGKD